MIFVFGSCIAGLSAAEKRAVKNTVSVAKIAAPDAFGEMSEYASVIIWRTAVEIDDGSRHLYGILPFTVAALL